MATISERLAYVLTFDTSSGVKSLENVGKAAEKNLGKTEQRLDKVGVGMQKFGAAALATAGLAGAGLFKLAGSASDLEESVNAVNVTFGDAAEGILDLGENAARAVGLSKTEFNGLAVQFSSFANTVAGEGGNVVGVMDDLTTRAADFASVMQLDVAEAARVFQSGLAGETEPLKKFGIDLSAAAVGAYAVANGISDSTASMTEAEKVQARYGLLMEQTAKTAGDFANTSDGAANQARILKAELSNAAADIGSGVLPVMTSLLQTLTKVTGAFANLSPEVKNAIGSFATAATGMLALGGAVSFVIGRVIVARDRFRELAASIGAVKASTLLAGAAFAAVAVSVGYLAFEIATARTAGDGWEESAKRWRATLAELADEFNQAETPIDGYKDKLGELLGQNPELLAAFTNLGLTVDDLLSPNRWTPEGLKVWREELAATLAASGVSEEQIESYIDTIDTYGRALQGAGDRESDLAAAMGVTAEAEDERSTAVDAAVAVFEEQQAAIDGALEGNQELAGAIERHTEKVEEITDAYSENVDAVNEWADGIRDSYNNGAASFMDFEVAAETTHSAYRYQLGENQNAQAAWESSVSTLEQNVLANLGSMEGVSAETALAWVASLGEMGEAGLGVVEGFNDNTDEIGPTIESWAAMSETSKDGIVGAFDPVGDLVAEKIDHMTAKMKAELFLAQRSAEVEAYLIGKAIPDGVVRGIEGGSGAVATAARSMISQIAAAAAEEAETASPSKLFAREIGAPIVTGVAQGIESEEGKLAEAITGAIDNARDEAVDSARDAVDDILAAVDDRVDSIYGGIESAEAISDTRTRVGGAKDKLADIVAQLAGLDPKAEGYEDDRQKLLDDKARAEESLRDANYRLLKLSEGLLLTSDRNKWSEWMRIAEAAGLSGRDVELLKSSIQERAQVQATSARRLSEAERRALSAVGIDLAHGGGSMNITVNALDPQAASRAVMDAIKAYERTNGASWRGVT